MSFWGTIVKKDEPFNLALDEDIVFHLTHAVIAPESVGAGKVYLVANVSLPKDDDSEDEEDNEEEEEEEEQLVQKIPICCLTADKVDQIHLDLHFDSSFDVVFTLEGDAKSATAVSICGTFLPQEEDQEHGEHDQCDDSDCDIDHNGAMFGEDYSDEDFSDDEEIDSDDEEMEEEMPIKKQLNGKPKAKITEITEASPDTKVAKKQPVVAAAPAKKQAAQPQAKPQAKPQQPQQQPQAKKQPQQQSPQAKKQPQQQPKREANGQPQKQNVKKAKN
eukprot:gene9786-11429_t